MQRDRKFTRGKIIDRNTVAGTINGKTVEIDIHDGGLPDHTQYVTVRSEKPMADGNIVIGAFVEGRVDPITVVGKIRT